MWNKTNHYQFFIPNPKKKKKKTDFFFFELLHIFFLQTHLLCWWWLQLYLVFLYPILAVIEQLLYHDQHWILDRIYYIECVHHLDQLLFNKKWHDLLNKIIDIASKWFYFLLFRTVKWFVLLLITREQKAVSNYYFMRMTTTGNRA